ncbi:sec-independent translocase [Sphaerisporangium sp. TRM90804]|uniref:sec-independent translocase n=1 Tax=Sphaerisporangium sp. TRM90804 TaxID=3031113 RepID=UPI00244D7A30|nr:sec-independent translocase [Sphaerisporangium sp. TRM90804]MDH2429859.1 sec-independent translocase [Sphaerisporangium sp. TRM90804]
MFGLGWPEVLALIVIALLVLGPEKLPQAASQAGRALRQLRQMANNAKSDLQDNLGPEFTNFDPADLHPKNFVRKHLLEDVEKDWDKGPLPEHTPLPPEPYTPVAVLDELGYGEVPPYDSEAT